ncbi:MAG: GNAT family N-acetyltransferase [Pseudomonadota bacterium]
MVQIRPLQTQDITECVDVLRALPQWFGIESAIIDYGKDLESLDGFVAIQDNIVGFVGLKRYGEYSIEVNVIGVLPTLRGQGIGSRLLAVVDQQATTEKTRLLHMKTLAPSAPDPNYVETRAFWEANGFIPMDAHLLWGEENPCQVMVKPFYTDRL